MSSTTSGDEGRVLQIELAEMIVETFSQTSTPTRNADTPMLAIGFPIESLPGIVQHGFLTPWELNLDVNTYRQHLETSVYGFDVKTLTSLAPKYAHYFDSRSTDGFHIAYLYGDMVAVLRPEVHRRTLVTSGDGSKLGIWDLSPLSEERRVKSTHGLQYHEGQILGPLDLNNVEVIYINRRNKIAMRHLNYLAKLAGEYNIQLMLYSPGGDLLTGMAQVMDVKPVTSTDIKGKKSVHLQDVSVGARFAGIEVDPTEVNENIRNNRRIYERLLSPNTSDFNIEDAAIVSVLRRIILTEETSESSKQKAINLYRSTRIRDSFLEYVLEGIPPERPAGYDDLKNFSTRQIQALQKLNYPFVESELKVLQGERNLPSWNYQISNDSAISLSNFNIRDFLTALNVLMVARERVPPQTMRSFFQYASINIIRHSEIVLNESQLRFIAKAWFIATFLTEGIHSDDLPQLFARQPMAKNIFRDEFIQQIENLSDLQSKALIRRAFEAYLHLEAIGFSEHESRDIQAKKLIEVVRKQPSRWRFQFAFALLPTKTYVRLTLDTLSRLAIDRILNENLELFWKEIDRSIRLDISLSDSLMERIKAKLLEWLSLQRLNGNRGNVEEVQNLLFKVAEKAGSRNLMQWMSEREFTQNIHVDGIERLRRKLSIRNSCANVFAN
ncbi:MAG: hypothetical protein ACK5P5_01375 [Pseudobdellovibrionaceae bacterium]